MSILKTTELKKIYGSGDTAVRALDGGRIDEAYITQIIETLGLSEKVNSRHRKSAGFQAGNPADNHHVYDFVHHIRRSS